MKLQIKVLELIGDVGAKDVSIQESWKAEPENHWENGSPGMFSTGEKGAVLGRSNCCSERLQKKLSTVSRSSRGRNRDASVLEASGSGRGRVQRRSLSLLSRISGHHHVVTRLVY